MDDCMFFVCLIYSIFKDIVSKNDEFDVSEVVFFCRDVIFERHTFFTKDFTILIRDVLG